MGFANRGLPVSLRDGRRVGLIVWRPHRLTVMGARDGETSEWRGGATAGFGADAAAIGRVAREPCARGGIFCCGVVGGGTSGSATRGVRDGAGAGPGIQQTSQWFCPAL